MSVNLSGLRRFKRGLSRVYAESTHEFLRKHCVNELRVRRFTPGLRLVYAWFMPIYAEFTQSLCQFTQGLRRVYAVFTLVFAKFMHDLSRVYPWFMHGLRRVSACLR